MSLVCQPVGLKDRQPRSEYVEWWRGSGCHGAWTFQMRVQHCRAGWGGRMEMGEGADYRLMASSPRGPRSSTELLGYRDFK